ncbi:MAG: nuclear transport factor 2 family protein [Planctomycetota bacterium]
MLKTPTNSFIAVLVFAAMLAAAPPTLAGESILGELTPHQQTRALALAAIDASMENPNVEVVKKLWSPDYIQHSPIQPTGVQPILDWVGAMETNGRGGFDYQLHRLVVDGDYIALHGRAVGFMDTPVVLVNIWRVEDGKLVEHWEGVQPEVTETVSGRSMLGGEQAIRDREKTQANKALVEDFLDTVIVQGQFDKLGNYFDGDNYLQHNPMIPDGVSGLTETLAKLGEQGVTMVYTKVHRVIAEGNLVVTHSEGTFGGKPMQFFDWFRIEDGKIAEHWDVIMDISGGSKNDNGIF